MELWDALAFHKVLPVIVLDDVAGADGLARALVAGGLPVAEVTLRTSAAIGAIRIMAAREDLLVGAGTVVTAAQVDAAVEAGARFVVSPGLSRAVVARCERYGVPCLPGVATPTEVMAAMDLGCSTVKFFPAASFGGPEFLAELGGPFKGVSFVPTGGIKPADLATYLRLPAVLAVGGTWMVPRRVIAAQNWDRVRTLVAGAVEAATPKGSLDERD